MSKLIDLTGQEFGKLTVLRRVENRNGRVTWECQCECGKRIVATGHDLKANHITSCGQHKAIDLTGQKFGELTVIKKVGSDNSRRSVWLCKCSCGEECEYPSYVLRKSDAITCKNHYVNTMIGKTFGELTVIEQTRHVDNKHMFLCKCSCGSTIEVSGWNLRSEHTRSCGCMGVSIGETHIKRLLKENNITYTNNKTFESCKFPDTGYYGFFDFYIHDDPCIIEFDGKQHFDYRGVGWDTKDCYLKTHSHDLFKNKWAWENNIPMKRIPFKERDKLTIHRVMSNEFLISPQTHPEWYPPDNSEYPYFNYEKEVDS